MTTILFVALGIISSIMFIVGWCGSYSCISDKLEVLFGSMAIAGVIGIIVVSCFISCISYDERIAQLENAVQEEYTFYLDGTEVEPDKLNLSGYDFEINEESEEVYLSNE